jgi:transposase
MLSQASKEAVINIPNLPGAVNTLERALQKWFGHADYAVAIEGYGSCGEHFVLELLERGYPVYELNPKKSANLRNIFSENSSDGRDARMFARSILYFPDALTPVKTDREVSTIKRLGRLREGLVESRTRCLNQLHRTLLDGYGIAYRSLFRELKTKKALKFFEIYPSINQALRHPQEVKRLLGPESWQSLERCGRWRDDSCLEAIELQVKLLVERIALYTAQINTAQGKLSALLENGHRNQLEGLRGVGISIKGVIIPWGDRGCEPFPESRCLRGPIRGLAPASKQSGGGDPVSAVRKRYNRRLKQAFCQLALVQLREEGPSRDYFLKKRREGNLGRVAQLALARWLARIVYRMLLTRSPYRWPRRN